MAGFSGIRSEEYSGIEELEKYLKQKGITYQKLMSDSNKNQYRKIVNALYYLKIEEIINEKQAKNGMLIT